MTALLDIVGTSSSMFNSTISVGVKASLSDFSAQLLSKSHAIILYWYVVSFCRLVSVTEWVWVWSCDVFV